MRSVNVESNRLTVDGVPITVLTNEEYQANKDVGTHVVVLVENFVRIRRVNGNAMMQIPASPALDTKLVLQRLVSWFMLNEGDTNSQLEDAVRAVAAGGPIG